MRIVLVSLFLITGFMLKSQNNFEALNFLIGNWSGTGSGFGNTTSKINSSFQTVMDGMYIEVINDSRFEPTSQNLKGEHHRDMGFISYDKYRKKLIFRQFNVEGYVNQYLLSDSLSNDSTLVFETENIENFFQGGKARWTIIKKSVNEIETVFDVGFPNKAFSCFGRNVLKKQ